MEKKKILHGCSICGGDVVEHIDTLALATDKHTCFLEDVPVGECEECGAKYYSSQTSQRMDEVVQQALKEKRFTKRSLKNLRIHSARNLLKAGSVFEKQIFECIGHLEQTVKRLVETSVS
jgi:YgiT-type zinc finger domain-containing protein